MRRLLLGLATLLALAVVADFAAAVSTEYRLSRAIRVGAGLSVDPEVTIRAVPFLAHVPGGRADSVTVAARDVTEPIPYPTSVRVRFDDVAFHPMTDPAGSLHAGSATARLVIGQTTLGRLLGMPDLEVAAAPEAPRYRHGPPPSPDRALLTGTVQAPTAEDPSARRVVSVVVYLVLDGSRLSLVPAEVRAGPSPGPVPPLDIVGPQFAAVIDFGALPYGIGASSVSVDDTALVVEGRARDVTVDPAAIAPHRAAGRDASAGGEHE